MSKYIENGLITICLEGKKKHVAFKKTGFTAPWAQEGALDIPELVEKETELQNNLFLAYRGKREAEIAELESESVLLSFISPYIDSEQSSNALFDILDGKQFKIASIPDSAKADLSDENESLSEENKQLKARLAQLEAVEETVEENPEPETK